MCRFEGKNKCPECQKMYCGVFHYLAENNMCLGCWCTKIIRRLGCPHNTNDWIASDKTDPQIGLVLKCSLCHIEKYYNKTTHMDELYHNYHIS
jgi:hypothetical protein